MEPGARVCPFCGEPPGSGVFCAACGRNLSGVEQLPTRREWEDASQAGPDPDGSPPPPASAADAIDAFLAAMHAAGDPGTTKTRRSEPGFLGRTQHALGWVVRAVGRDEDEPGGYEPGLFLTVDGRLHRLTSATRGMGQRDGVRYLDIVGPEVGEPEHDDLIAGELASLLHAHGLHAGSA